MSHLSRSLFLFGVVVLITALVPILGCPRPTLVESKAPGNNNGIPDRLAALESALAQSQSDLADVKADLAMAIAKLAYVRVQDGTINGLNGPHLIIEGCNVHVRSGSGDSTDGTLDSDNLYAEIPNTTPTGLGNLILGYNEVPQFGSAERTGSHNLVVGPGHNFTNVGGVLFGEGNYSTGPFTSVLGGSLNTASGFYSSVLGGLLNRASARISSVGGGFSNDASGYLSSVGGYQNTASGQYSSVCGGRDNTASGDISCVSGGAYNTASGGLSSVSGGQGNAASGYISSVSGGYGRTAPADLDWVAGSLFQDQ